MVNPALELIRLVENFGAPKILLVGDLILDQYIYGNADRLSPEAPVPVITEKYRETRAGGAGNVASDLAVLGAKVWCVSICGNDASGGELTRILREAGTETSGVMVVPERPTSTKVRLVGLAQHRHPQQMLRLDHEDTTPISEEIAKKLLGIVAGLIADMDVVCIEDYNKGLLTRSFTQELIALAKQHGKPVLVDPAPISDYSKYKGVTTITPNRTEAELATGLPLKDGVDNAPALAEHLLQQLNLETCILTLDRHGIYLLQAGQKGVQHITKQRKVYDVTGAGDMVLATLAMARVSGATWSQAVDLANVAGGLEVEKFGCVPVKKEEILADLLAAETQTQGKVRTQADLLADVARHRKANQRIVFTNGVFDILHAGHTQYLHFARGQGDVLVVGVNADDSARRLKGAGRPVNGLADRMAVLAGLAAVDYVIPFEADTPVELITALLPDVLVKGEDYRSREVVGREIVERQGGKVVLAPFLAGRSTSVVIEKTKSPQN